MEEIKKAENRHKTSISLVEAIPSEVDANSKISIKAKISCAFACSLQGDKIKIINFQGEEITEVELELADGSDNEIVELMVQAPSMPGEHTWKIVYPTQQKEDTLHEESSVELSFKVRPHQISLSVWGIPSPVNKDEKFKIKIGAKCLAGCSLAGLPFVILDDNNIQVADGKLGENVLPQTEGMYWTEQDLRAPADEALHKWVVQSLTSELECPHQSNTENFSFHTAKPPEHTVTIEVTSKEDHTPLKDAYIFLGLHRAVTDEQGKATLSVPGGNLKMYISKNDYVTIEKDLEVVGDATVKIELEFSPVL